MIGCVKCGREVAAEGAVWEGCPTCGKTVGFCVPCTGGLKKVGALLLESIEWHQQVRHATEPLMRAYG